ncbi:MAG: hypothetical protein M1426_04315, partial [Patescibacteria group bacterium]|nr:hypothetical protein [Patescibacteria group bacterium]
LFDCKEIKNLKSIDKLTVTMDNSLNSIIYFFHPIQGNGKLLIYQQGHRDEYLAEENTLPVTVEKGYSVITLLMPLMGLNNKPAVDIPGLGKLKLLNHNYLIMLKTETLSPIKYFMEPVAVAINYALGNYKFNSVFMTGISGGGWTTTLYAALDTRILRSYPTAGTLPTFMRIERDWGDWEQYEPELYRIANFIDLYILGSYGDSRKQYQMLNKYDSCCFAGIKYQVYEKDVKDAVSRLGKGAFDIYLDDSHKSHKISEASLKIILNDIESAK